MPLFDMSIGTLVGPGMNGRVKVSNRVRVRVRVRGEHTDVLESGTL